MLGADGGGTAGAGETSENICTAIQMWPSVDAAAQGLMAPCLQNPGTPSWHIRTKSVARPEGRRPGVRVAGQSS